jgi:hypothetical protein
MASISSSVIINGPQDGLFAVVMET